MATVIKKLSSNAWDVNGVAVTKENYRDLLEDERDVKNFEYHLVKTTNRRIYRSTYPYKDTRRVNTF